MTHLASHRRSPPTAGFQKMRSVEVLSLTALFRSAGVVHRTGRRVDERERSPPNLATALVDCASLVHPTAQRHRGGRCVSTADPLLHDQASRRAESTAFCEVSPLNHSRCWRGSKGAGVRVHLSSKKTDSTKGFREPGLIAGVGIGSNPNPCSRRSLRNALVDAVLAG